jgi:hypothetical protein
MAQSGDVTSFFSLPVELREQIYQEALKSPTAGPDLLQTCREINTEARKFWYQRQIRFPSQFCWYNWVASTPERFLPQVTDICLTIQEVDLRSVLDLNTSASETSLSGRLHTWDLYAMELRNLKAALGKLPNVSKITIRAMSCRQSHLYRDFLAEFLDSLSSIYPTLLDLNLEGNPYYQNLDFLSGLAKLRSFSFDGISASSPLETADILGNLEHLSSLSLISHQAMVRSSSLRNSEFMGKPQPFIGDAVRTIDQLASLSVSERASVPTANFFFSLDVLNAMQHHKALKSLSISLSHTPDNEMLNLLGRCLESSSIDHLELDWPQLEVETIKKYPLVQKCIKSLWIKASSTDHAFRILSYILERRRSSDLKELRELVLIRAIRDYNVLDMAMYDRKDSGCVMEGEGSHVVSLSVSITNEKAPHACTILLDTASSTCGKRFTDFVSQYDYVAENSTDDITAQIKRRLEGSGVRVAWYTEDT